MGSMQWIHVLACVPGLCAMTTDWIQSKSSAHLNPKAWSPTFFPSCPWFWPTGWRLCLESLISGSHLFMFYARHPHLFSVLVGACIKGILHCSFYHPKCQKFPEPSHFNLIWLFWLLCNLQLSLKKWQSKYESQYYSYQYFEVKYVFR